MSAERLDKLLSHEGFGTRRDIKRLVRAASITVNGLRVTDSGTPVDADCDEVAIDGQPVELHKNIYLMMNKMSGVVSAKRDPLFRTVFDCLDAEYKSAYLSEKLHIVGRLDRDTEGLLLFTTDGILTHRIISPKTNCPKTYFVRLEQRESEERQRHIAQLFRSGIHIPAEDNDEEADCKSAALIWQTDRECLLTITEGRYHQVKRMFTAAGNAVAYLKRIAIGALHLDPALPSGCCRKLTRDEALMLQDGLIGKGAQ